MPGWLTPALDAVHPGWLPFLCEPVRAARIDALGDVLAERARTETIFPERNRIFRALSFFAPADTRVVILGQDPYHGRGEATGLAFSVPAGSRIPPSLRNIRKEIGRDLDETGPQDGDLAPWCRQGVLLLNSVLTVAEDRAASHAGLGWETITDDLIGHVSDTSPACVFMLWGNAARGKATRIDGRHLVLEAAHPSPLSASRGFHGCAHFSRANAWLASQGHAAIRWSTPSGQASLW